jgi:hypothetical protein
MLGNRFCRRFYVLVISTIVLSGFSASDILADEASLKDRPGTVELRGVENKHIAGEEEISDLNN